MILYALRCANNHQFEAWFRNSAGYDALAAAGEVLCPVCGGGDVTKAPMAPHIHKSGKSGGDKAPAAVEAAAPADAGPAPDAPVAPAALPVPVDHPGPAAPAMTGAAAAKLRHLLTEVRQHIENNCDYVGDRFAEEARRIHYNETAPRNIYGETTPDEAEALHDEGVIFQRIPWVARTDS